MSRNKNIAQEHLGIIAKVALRYWRVLPQHITASYDAEDMIGDVIVHVLQRARHYKRHRASSSTFVWHVADNYCKVILARYRAKKRTGLLVPMEHAAYLAHSNNEFQFAISRNTVEHVIADASGELRVLLAAMVEHRFHGSIRRVDPALVEEMRCLSRKHGATYQHFHNVLVWA